MSWEGIDEFVAAALAQKVDGKAGEAIEDLS